MKISAESISWESLYPGGALSGTKGKGSPPGEKAAKSEVSSGAEEASSQELTEKEDRRVKELKKIDSQVRAHEAAHMAAASGLVVRGAQYEYEKGPDGHLYAVGGDVQIDTSKENGDPAANLRKAEKIQRAALAPQDPSTQDRKVAAEARAMAAEAQAELMEKKRKEMKSSLEEYGEDEGGGTGLFVETWG